MSIQNLVVIIHHHLILHYNPKGLLAVPFPLAELTAVLAAPLPPPVDKPKGFPFVGARLPAAPVMSFSEFPYSRTMSPHERDVFAMLAELLASVPDQKIRIYSRYSSPLSSTRNAIASRRHYSTSSFAHARRRSRRRA